MRITGTGPVNQPNSVKKKKRISDSGDFGSLLSGVDETEDAVSVSQATPVSAMDSLLSLQEVGEAPSFLQEAKQRGWDFLECLDEIRHGLLTGSLSEERLRSLNNLLEKNRPEVVDPKLNAILDEIEIRAAVELAKLERNSL